MTTHYLEEAEEADHVCIINNGKIVAEGTPSDIKQKLVQEYLVVDTKEYESLEKELKKNKLKYSKNGHIKIDLRGKNAQKVIQSIKTPLTYLDIHNPSLEDAYLEIVGEKTQ